MPWWKLRKGLMWILRKVIWKMVEWFKWEISPELCWQRTQDHVDKEHRTMLTKHWKEMTNSTGPCWQRTGPCWQEAQDLAGKWRKIAWRFYNCEYFVIGDIQEMIEIEILVVSPSIEFIGDRRNVISSSCLVCNKLWIDLVVCPVASCSTRSVTRITGCLKPKLSTTCDRSVMPSVTCTNKTSYISTSRYDSYPGSVLEVWILAWHEDKVLEKIKIHLIKILNNLSNIDEHLPGSHVWISLHCITLSRWSVSLHNIIVQYNHQLRYNLIPCNLIITWSFIALIRL